MTIGFLRGIRIGSRDPIPEPVLRTLVGHLSSCTRPTNRTLAGRALPDFLDLPIWGPAVVKHYLRGGWIRLLNHRSYLRTRYSRSRAEYEMLASLHAQGLDVPRPLAWAESGRIWIQAWLIMEERQGVQSLVDLARSQGPRARALMPAVSQAVRRLIELHVHHPDLHPGNILIDAADRACLIDFDKARKLSCSSARLAALYWKRWHRAVAKYQLPPWLAEELDLRSVSTKTLAGD